MINTMNRFSYFLFILVLFACEPSAEKCVLAPEVKIELSFSSLEDSIPTIRTKQELVDFFSRHVALRDVFFWTKKFSKRLCFYQSLFQEVY